MNAITIQSPPITNSQFKTAVKNDWHWRFHVWQMSNYAKRLHPGPKPRFRRGTGHLAYLGKSGQRAADVRAEVMALEMALQGGV